MRIFVLTSYAKVEKATYVTTLIDTIHPPPPLFLLDRTFNYKIYTTKAEPYPATKKLQYYLQHCLIEEGASRKSGQLAFTL